MAKYLLTLLKISILVRSGQVQNLRRAMFFVILLYRIIGQSIGREVETDASDADINFEIHSNYTSGLNDYVDGFAHAPNGMKLVPAPHQQIWARHEEMFGVSIYKIASLVILMLLIINIFCVCYGHRKISKKIQEHDDVLDKELEIDTIL